jgi:uncharacterized RDD family membrane protein YckC
MNRAEVPSAEIGYRILKGIPQKIKAFRLRVFRNDGAEIGWLKAIVRSLLYLISGLPAFLGFVWALFDKQKQAWHDKIVHTKVSYLPKNT